MRMTRLRTLPVPLLPMAAMLVAALACATPAATNPASPTPKPLPATAVLPTDAPPATAAAPAPTPDLSPRPLAWFAPLPPNTIFPLGTKPVFEELPPSIRLPAAVSVSPTVTGIAAVAVFDDSPELGRMLIRAAIAVASKDGSLTAAEEKAVRQLCYVLGLEVGELKQPARRGQDEDAGEEEDEEDI